MTPEEEVKAFMAELIAKDERIVDLEEALDDALSALRDEEE